MIPGTVKCSWNNGPLRRFYTNRVATHLIPHDTGEYAGTYVCDSCRKDVVGVYGPLHGGRWLCSPCKQGQKSTFKGHIDPKEK